MKTNPRLCIYTGIFALLALGGAPASAVTLLDHTFDTDGRVITTGGPHTNNIATGLAFQPDGKIVVSAAITVGEARSQFGAARYLPDGTLDSTFGTGGVTWISFPLLYAPQSKCVAIQPDGKIVVVGNGESLAIARFQSNGAVDTSFNGTGRVWASLGNGPGYSDPRSVAVQPDGKIVIAGTFYNGTRCFMSVVRYNSNGTRDTTYATAGQSLLALSEDSYAQGMVLQPDGKILLAGFSRSFTTEECDAALVRYNSNGTLDLTFNGTGIVTHRLGGRNSFATSVTLRSDGKIIIGGGAAIDGGDSETGELFNAMAARYEADGTLDTTFGTSGFAKADFGVTHTEVASAVLQGDKVTLVGIRHDPGADGNNYSDFAMVRFDADGAQDSTFNVGGLALVDFNRGQDHAYAAGVQADGKIVAVGLSQNATNPGGYSTDMVLVRLNLDGASTPAEDDGGGVGLKGPPKINRGPISQIVPLGGNLNLFCSHAGQLPMTYQWYKNGTAISGATGRSYSVPMNVSAADIGKYTVKVTNALGSKTSKPAFVGVIDTEFREVNVEATRKATLNARATLPPGTPVTYQWHYNNEPLKNGAKFTGVKTATLTLRNPQFGDDGDYTCLVSIAGGADGLQWNQSSNFVTIVEPAPKPVMNPVTLANATVNDVVSHTLTATNNPTSFDAKGLPPGVVLNTATGVLSGSPTTAKLAGGQPVPYKVTFTASNGGGKSNPLTVDWLILPLSQELTGAYHGLVDRDAALNGNTGAAEGLGGSIRVLATSQGVMTGVLTLGKQTYRFTTPVTTSGSGGTTIATIKRSGNQSPLSLSLSLVAASGELSGIVTDGVVGAEVSGVRQTATAAGRYTQALNSATASGTGSATLTLSTTGTATWAGKLADGTAITGSSASGPQGEVSLHRLLYANSGSVQGWVQIQAGAVAGELSWLKTVNGIQTLDVQGAKAVR